jgi:glycosyltransferase involved in cell wall biosynthesis
MSRALAKLARRLKPDLFHAHWLSESGWLAARESLDPLICSAWGSDVYGVGGLQRQRSRRALSAAELVLADSADLARATRKLADREVRIEVVRWGLDLNRFAPGDRLAARSRLGLPDRPLVVSVRGLGSIYNPVLLIEAFARVRATVRDALLVLKQPDSRAPRSVTTAIERLRVRDAVVLLGGLPAEAMPDLYRAADVVVSIPSTDSSPRSVWEALACGRPVVVSDLAWARDELADGRNALLVGLEPSAVAGAITHALEDVECADGLSAEGRAVACAELDPAAAAARIDALYRSVVER